VKGKLVAKERYKHFQGVHRKAMLELKEGSSKGD
jgi:hypothetical protein